MGPHYDNEAGKYIKDDEVFNAHWLVDEEDMLYLIPREGDGFDSYGPDNDEKLEILNNFSDKELSNEELMEKNGFAVIHSFQRRFDESSGYYYA